MTSKGSSRRTCSGYQKGEDRPPEQTAAFQRVLSRALVHAQSAGQEQIDAEDILAATYHEPQSSACYLLQKQGITRLDVLNYISHGISKLPDGEPLAPHPPPELDSDDEGEAAPTRDRLAALTANLVARAAGGVSIHSSAARPRSIRTIQVLCRRRKDNPIYVATQRSGKTTIAEGLALKIHRNEVPEPLKETEIYQLITLPQGGKRPVPFGRCLPGCEYLGIDVMAFAEGKLRWRFPTAVIQLENSRADDRVAYSLWKVLSLRADLRMVFCYRRSASEGLSGS